MLLFSQVPTANPNLSQVLLPCRNNPCTKYRTPQRGIDSAKRIHNRFQPNFKHLGEKLPDSFLCLRAGRVVGYAGAPSCRAANRKRRRGAGGAAGEGGRRKGGIGAKRREGRGGLKGGGGSIGGVG